MVAIFQASSLVFARGIGKVSFYFPFVFYQKHKHSSVINIVFLDYPVFYMFCQPDLGKICCSTGIRNGLLAIASKSFPVDPSVSPVVEVYVKPSSLAINLSSSGVDGSTLACKLVRFSFFLPAIFT